MFVVFIIRFRLKAGMTEKGFGCHSGLEPESNAPVYDLLQTITILNDKTSKISQFGEKYSKFVQEESQQPDRLDAKKEASAETKKIILKDCL